MEFLALKHLYWVIPAAIIALGAAFWAFQQRKRTIALLTQGATKCNLQSNASPIRRRILAISLLLSLAFALLTVLRPTGGTQLSEHRRPAKNIVVLLDISTSMDATDVDGVSRIDAAKLLLREFINSRPTDKIGLVSFAGGSFPECPITLDRSMLLQRVNKIKTGEIPVGGTDILVALETADKLLTDEPPPGSAVLIISDGDNVTGGEPEKVLGKFAKNNIPVLSVALGLNNTSVNIPRSDLVTTSNHEILFSLSNATNGIFIAASPKELDAQIAKLGARIDTIEIDGTNVAAELYERPLELYAYPLTLALILLMIHLFLPLRTKNWHPLTAALVLLFALPQPAKSEEFTSYEAALESAVTEEKPLLLLFTGSDWSKQSITFEREILSHPVYQKWADAQVISMTIDLPRVGITDEERKERRTLAAKFGVEAYPMAVFVDKDGNKTGSLTHDPDGPNSWVKRANAVLAGDTSQSDTAASIDYLPKEVKENLNDPNITDAQRSVRLYNKALELERTEPDIVVTSEDRFDLLTALYQKAADEAPADRPDLAFPARHKLALLNHRLGKHRTPKSEEEMMMLSMTEQMEPAKLMKRARASYRKALSLYKDAAPLKPGDKELSTNLTLVYRDLARIEAYIAYMEAYLEAVNKTTTALGQEENFVRSLERDVTTRREVNKKAIEESAASIQTLVQAAEAIEDSPTILPKEGLKDYRLADEDIVLAPSPHRERDLRAARQHLQDALDHLIDPQQMQPQPSSGEGSGEPQPDGEEPDEGEEEENEGGRQGDLPEEDGGGRDEGEEEGKGDADADLRRADNETGDLRGRMLKKLGEQGKYVPRSKDH
ncbi:MAG: VWA domain-containing protein [Akkermansiaceae bacterium]|jgi:Ca-activated chloride channel homolog